jgi:1-acyl-sn-glycerol-3-phosphate acyltransferase
MRTIQAIAKLAAFAVVTGGLFLVRLAWRNRRGRHWVFRTWAWLVARLVGLRITVAGGAPTAPFLLVCNHLSYVDIVLLASQLDCVFVAKQDVRNWPVLGLMVAHMDTIFIDRASRRDVVRVNTQMERALQRGDGVVLFAEGTSTRGDRVLPFKPSLLNLPAHTNFPVSHAAISYRAPAGAVPAEQSVCWWGDMTFPSHFFHLLKLPQVEARLVFGDEPVQATDRKYLARKLHQSVSEHFVPVTL